MRETEIAASFSRGFGIGIAVFVASTFLWLRLQDDAARIQQVHRTVMNIKQAYRTQAAILTCWETGSLFDTDKPKPAIKMIIPPIGMRDHQFDIDVIDKTVERKQCKIDVNPQNIDIALHEAGINWAFGAIGSTQRFAAKTH